MNSRQVVGGSVVGRVRWWWAARQLRRKMCVKFLVGGWLRWERERRSQRGVVCREIDEGLKRFRGWGGPCFRCVSIWNRHLFLHVQRRNKGLYRAEKWRKLRGGDVLGRNKREKGWRWCFCMCSVLPLLLFCRRFHPADRRWFGTLCAWKPRPAPGWKLLKSLPYCFNMRFLSCLSSFLSCMCHLSA